MKRIIKSRLEEHMVDLYSRVDNLKKDIAVIKNNHLKHMSCAIYKIEKKVDKILWAMIGGMGALILTLIAIAFKFIK
jgi:archaellum component FlaC